MKLPIQNLSLYALLFNSEYNLSCQFVLVEDFIIISKATW